MVTVVKDNRVVGQTGFLKFTKVFADELVHHRDPVVVLCPVLAHLRSVGVVGGKVDLGRVMDTVDGADLVPHLALVTDCVVEDGEEWLSVWPVFPMRLSAAVIPNLAYLFKVVILLGIVCTVVAELAEVGGVHFEVVRQAGHAAHMLRAGGRRVDTGDDRCAGWGADRRV